ncbi:MAG TPA: AAA family ATPase, partial [Clostridiales bacterium UBA9857]|nr:AAA family ATPase [Clostridiales bacterium UBA9857]
MDGPLLILAGAGSGKTTVLTRRVAYLISRGVEPWSILAITFTNKAANELKSRIRALLGNKAEGVWAMTFHAACLRILRTEYPAIGKDARFAIMDTHDQLRIMRQVLKEMNLSERQYSPSGMLRIISGAKDKLWDPDTLAKQAVSFYETKAAQAYALYQKKLTELNGMDFDDLIMQTVLLLREHKHIREKYQAKFKYILVDEYQDTNVAQYLWLRLLGQPRSQTQQSLPSLTQQSFASNEDGSPGHDAPAVHRPGDDHSKSGAKEIRNICCVG